MATQLKQRIVGILVLLFLALIILPWIFGSNQRAVFEEKRDPKKLTMTPTSKELNDRFKEVSQPIVDVEQTTQEPVKTRPELEAPEKQTIMPQPKIKPGPINPKVAQSDEQDQVDENPVTELEPAKLSQIQNKMMHTETKIQPSKTVSVKVKAPDIKKPALAKISMPEPKTKIKNPKKESAKSWTVQLGSFSDSQNADKLIKQLKEKGFSAYSKLSKNAEGDAITRVLVGPNQKHNTPESTISTIAESLNIHGVIVKSGL